MMESCEVRHHDCPDMKNSITHPDNNPNQDPNRRARQAHTSEEKSAAAGYQHLPHRPKAGRSQRDPLDYESHLSPSMKHFAELLALRFHTPRKVLSQTILRIGSKKLDHP